MELDETACFKALRARDARFDGRFFTGVVTTGIYCRPVCPARPARRENLRFFPCAAAAQAAGFRPCLRCRPEASPGTPAWFGTSVTVARALRLIAEGALDADSVDDLAARVGVGDRHLRRLFLTHLGATPIAVAQTQRVLFAKKLIDETDLPMTEIALAAGFASIRRFNSAIRGTYGRPPTALRRLRPGIHPAASSAIELRLAFRPPFAWDVLLGFLGRRAIPGVEVVERGVYQRTFDLDGARGTVAVRSVPGRDHLVARIRTPSAAALPAIVVRLRRLFDLQADPQAIGAHLGGDPQLAPAVRALPGLRVPGAWDGFELAVRAILGQQVSVLAAKTLAGRLVTAFGDPLSDAEEHSGLQATFPRPAALAHADVARIGIPRARGAAIQALAAAVAAERLDLDAPGDPTATLETLRALPGIGEWTVQYIAMRALREPDAFPAADLGLRRALGTKPPTGHDGDGTHRTGSSARMAPGATRRKGSAAPRSTTAAGRNGDAPPRRLASAAQVERAAEPWRPWRAYATLYLWTGEDPDAAAD